jgi:HEPN domain-containing protein
VSRPSHEKWIERSQYDLETADALLAAGRHIYVVFMCQQALEKAFKAVLAFRGLEVPPIHNLRRLAEAGGFLRELQRDELRRLDFLSQFYLNARYKEDIQELSRQVGEDTAREFVWWAREKFTWCTRELMR